SIITPVYNSGKYLKDTIETVVSQTYENWEMILVDDGSCDESVAIVQSYVEQDNRFILIRNGQNKGPAFSRNVGIKVASGSYLTFLDADDLWDSNFLEKSLGFLESNQLTFVFSSYRRVDENLNKLYENFIVPDKVSYNS